MRRYTPANVRQSFTLHFKAGRTNRRLGWGFKPNVPHLVGKVGFTLGYVLARRWAARAGEGA